MRRISVNLVVAVAAISLLTIVADNAFVDLTDTALVPAGGLEPRGRLGLRMLGPFSAILHRIRNLTQIIAF